MQRLTDLEPYRVDAALLELAAPDAFVMHCDTFHAAAPNRHGAPRLMATNILLRSPRG